MLPKLRTATVAVSDDSTMPTIFPHIRPADITYLAETGQRQSNVRMQQKRKINRANLILIL